MQPSAPEQAGSGADNQSGGRPPRHTPRHPTRRRFLQGAALLGGMVALGAGYGRLVEPRWVDVEHVVIPVAGLPPSLAGKRFAQLSDLHLGDYFTREQLLQSVEQVNRLGVDWLVLTGDYATPHPRGGGSLEATAEGLIEPLRKAEVPVYAAIGNHDLWEDVDTIIRYLELAGARLLRNSGVQLESGLWLGAVDDVWSGRPDLAAALRGAPSGSVNILLAHEPDYFDTVVAQDAPVAAQLSGHSHGGQVRLPSLTPRAGGYYSYAPILPDYGQRYPIGLHRLGDRMVYTNRGLGCWPIPFRLNCRPEITVYELQHRERFEAANGGNLR
jgi:predicted MPP superfamily phosphohydrolase